MNSLFLCFDSNRAPYYVCIENKRTTQCALENMSFKLFLELEDWMMMVSTDDMISLVGAFDDMPGWWLVAVISGLIYRGLLTSELLGRERT